MINRYFAPLIFAGAILAPNFSIAEDYTYPSVINQYRSSSSLAQNAMEKGVVGKTLKGRGRISEVSECGFWDAEYCHSGLKIMLEDGQDQVVIYESLDKMDALLALKPGSFYEFVNCEIVGLKEWGFHETIYCQH